MPVVGIAEVLVKPVTTGAQKSIGKEMDSAATSAGKSSGSKLGSALGSTLKLGAGVVGVAVGSTLALAITKGFGRLQAIENAKAKLTGLGHSADTVTAIMKNALASVKGTAFGLDEAATVAAGAVASGIAPGEQLERVLKLVADSASIANVPMGEMGAIFNKVASTGKVQGDVLAQLGDKGIPIVALLGKSLGVTSDEVYSMSKKGTIDFAMFAQAMEDGMGGAALKSGETLQGAFKNTLASLGRIGANLLSGVYPLFTKFFNGLMDFMAPLEDRAKVVGEALGQYLSAGAKAAGGLFDVLVKGDFSARFREAFNVEEDSKLTDFLFDVREGLIKTAGVVQGSAAILFKGEFLGHGIMGMEEDSKLVDFLFNVREGMTDLVKFVKGAGSILFLGDFIGGMGVEEDSQVVEFLFKIRDGFGSIGTALGQLKFESWDAFKSSLGEAGGTVGGAFASIFESLHTLAPAFEEFGRQLPSVTGALMKLGGLSLNVIVWGLGFLADHVDTIIKWMPAIVAGFIAWRIATKALAGAQFSLQAAQVLAAPVLLANNILRYASVRAETALAVATGQTTVATNVSLASKIKDRIVTMAGTAATIASTVAQKLATVATRALGIAIKVASGPIGLIIGAITLLVAGLVWFFTQTDLGKDIVKNAFAMIKSAAAAVVDWWNSTLVPALQTVGQWFADVWNGAVDVVSAAVQWIQDAAANVVSWWNETLIPGLQSVGQWFADVWNGAALAVEAAIQWIMDAAGNVASFFDTYVAQPIAVAIQFVASIFVWWYEHVIKPVFDSVYTIVNGFYLGFRGLFQLVVSVFENIIAPAFMSFWKNTIKPVFDAAVLIITGWWNKAKFIFDTAIAFVRGTLHNAFTWIRDRIDAVFTFIRTKIESWWNFAKSIFDVAITFIRGTLHDAFTWIRDRVVAVFTVVSAKVQSWWDYVKFVFDVAIAFVRGKLHDAFTWIRDRVTIVFDMISEKVESWWNKAKFIFDLVVGFVRGKLHDAFAWLRDRIDAVFTIIGTKISGVWNDKIKPVFDIMSSVIKDTLPKAFQTGIDAIKTIWDKLLDVAKAPVRFVINTVINDGLIGAFNKVAKILPGIDELPRVALPWGFARGGILPGQSSWRNGDDQLVPMRAGEGVLMSEVMKDPFERARLYAMNRAALAGRSMGEARALLGEGFAKGGIVNPLKNMSYTQGYNRVHKGIDLAASVGTPVFATENGRVSWSGPGVQAPGVWGGNEIHVDGESGIQTWFAHLSSMAVKVGDMVRAGMQIAQSGNTGISSGPHLHFGAFNGGWPNDIDPASYLGGAGAPSGGLFNPLGFITGLVDKVAGQVSGAFPLGGFMVDAVTGFGKKMLTDVIDWAKKKIGIGAAAGQGSQLDPVLYDGGGVLRPGLSQVLNLTGKPEAIYTAEQNRALQILAARGAGGGEGMTYSPTYQWMGDDPNRVMAKDKAQARDTFASYGFR